jgi:hypothetical protein
VRVTYTYVQEVAPARVHLNALPCEIDATGLGLGSDATGPAFICVGTGRPAESVIVTWTDSLAGAQPTLELPDQVLPMTVVGFWLFCPESVQIWTVIWRPFPFALTCQVEVVAPVFEIDAVAAWMGP